jgi:hypothetical protein
MQKIVLNMCGPQHHIGEVVWEVVWEMFWGKAFKTFMFLSKSIECMSFFSGGSLGGSLGGSFIELMYIRLDELATSQK